MFLFKIKENSEVSFFRQKLDYTQHRRLRSLHLSSDPWKNYPSATESIFGFSWIMFSTDAKERAGFPSSLASRAPRSEADFSTLNFNFWLSDCPKIWFRLIFLKMKTTLSIESKFSDCFLYLQMRQNASNLQNDQFWLQNSKILAICLILKVKATSRKESNNFDQFFTFKRVDTHQIYKMVNFGSRNLSFWLPVYFLKLWTCLE